MVNTEHRLMRDAEDAIRRVLIESLADRVRALLSNGLAREGHDILKAKFAKLDSVGPSWAARVAQEHGKDFEQTQRSAYEYAQALFAATEGNG